MRSCCKQNVLFVSHDEKVYDKFLFSRIRTRWKEALFNTNEYAVTLIQYRRRKSAHLCHDANFSCCSSSSQSISTFLPACMRAKALRRDLSQFVCVVSSIMATRSAIIMSFGVSVGSPSNVGPSIRMGSGSSMKPTCFIIAVMVDRRSDSPGEVHVPWPRASTSCSQPGTLHRCRRRMVVSARYHKYIFFGRVSILKSKMCPST